jgi:pimeloyl-ACP methyl ester carboxylesterase
MGYRVWAPDLRGYGGTTRPVGVAAYALEHLLADVAALIDAAGATEVLLIGHDWGALIAWYYAMFGRRAIAKLIIMNVPHPALAERGMRTLRQLKKSWYIFFFQLPRLPEYFLARNGYAAIATALRGMAVDKSRFPPDVLAVYKQSAAQPGALTAMLNYYRALLRGLRRMRARGMPPIRVPVLMLWGEVDAALGKELTYGTEEHVGDLVLRYLPRVSHWVQQEAPETVNTMMAAWLQGEAVPYAPGATPA